MLVPNLVNRPDSRVIIVQRSSVVFCGVLWWPMILTSHQTRESLTKYCYQSRLFNLPPPPTDQPSPTNQSVSWHLWYRDTEIQRYRMWEFKFPLSLHHIRCKKVETIVLTMCAGRLVITRTGLDTKQRIRSEVENISPSEEKNYFHSKYPAR